MVKVFYGTLELQDRKALQFIQPNLYSFFEEKESVKAEEICCGHMTPQPHVVDLVYYTLHISLSQDRLNATSGLPRRGTHPSQLNPPQPIKQKCVLLAKKLIFLLCLTVSSELPFSQIQYFVKHRAKALSCQSPFLSSSQLSTPSNCFGPFNNLVIDHEFWQTLLTHSELSLSLTMVEVKAEVCFQSAMASPLLRPTLESRQTERSWFKVTGAATPQVSRNKGSIRRGETKGPPFCQEDLDSL